MRVRMNSQALAKLSAWILFSAVLVLCVGLSGAAEDLEINSELTSPAATELAEDTPAPAEAPTSVSDPKLQDLPWAPLLDSQDIVPLNESCGACNCNEDDDCNAICGRPASCERRICPCATCTGSCQC